MGRIGMITPAFCSFCGSRVDERASVVKIFSSGSRYIVVFCSRACRIASETRLDTVVNDAGAASR